jgi:hypothetical protein
MPSVFRRPVVARMLQLETLEERTVLSVTIQLDYSYDTNGFFAQQSRRDVMQAAADYLGYRLGDSLSAIVPSGQSTWSMRFQNPADGTIATISNPTVAADTLIVFVGGRDIAAPTLGMGGFGAYSASSFTQTWFDLLKSRGQAGALLTTPTDFASWGGSIAFDNVGPDWYFGTSDSERGAGQADFFSVALHEMGHLLGIGTSASWNQLVVGGAFTGANVVAKYGSAPAVQSGGGHFGEGVSYAGQEVAMDPSITQGTRKLFTELDFAALQDVGWQISTSNRAPLASAGGVYSIVEGQSLTLNAAGSYDQDANPLTYSWDVNGDGTFGDATGVNPTLTWAQLGALGITDGPFSTPNLRVRVSDGLTTSASPRTTLTVANAGPTAAISVPSLGLRGGGLNGNLVRGETGTFTLTASDPSAADQAAGFTFAIDWNGDGTFDQTVVGASGTQVQHLYSDAASYNIRVAATDANAAQGSVAQTAVKIVDWDFRTDAVDSSKTNLVWGGTNGFDSFGFAPGGVVLLQALNNQFFATTQVVFTGAFNGKLIVYGQGSSDLIFADVMTQPVQLFGGDGDDVLVGGRGADYLDGGDGKDILFGGTLESDGDDTIYGGSGDDFIVGSYGADWLYGGAGQDLIVAGRLFFLNLPSSVFALQAEWTSSRPYADRVANLLGTGAGPRFNGNVFLTPGASAINDSSIDHLFGEADQDWLLVNLSQDLVSDLAGNETATSLGA